MKIATGVDAGTELFDRCAVCKRDTLQTATEVMLLAPQGARTIIAWSCEAHPLPELVTEETA